MIELIILVWICIGLVWMMRPSTGLGPKTTRDYPERGCRVHITPTRGWTEVYDQEKFDKYLKEMVREMSK
jgi:hypothetical protein